MKNRVKRVLAWALSVVMVLSASGIPMQTHAEEVAVPDNIQAEFFVAPAPEGDDKSDGSQEHPFATIEAARDAVREAKKDGMTGDIIVHIADGDYYLDDTLTFTPEDSGTDGYEVIYRGDSVDGANLIGGMKLEGEWVLADQTDVETYDMQSDMLGKVYKYQLSEDEIANLFYDESRELNPRQFNTLYVNDTRATMARTRNRDNNPKFPMAKGEYMRTTNGVNHQRNMYYNSADLTAEEVAAMQHAQERGEEIAQVFVWDGADWDWFTNTLPITSIDAGACKLQFPSAPEDYPEKYLTKYQIGGGARYFLQGNLNFLDVPGEYHYNKKDHILYYYPTATDGKIEDCTVVIPTMQKAVEFLGEQVLIDAPSIEGRPDLDGRQMPDPEKQVHNITLEGLAIKDTEFADYFTYSWNFGDGFYGEWIGYFPAESEGSSNPSFCESTDRPEFRVGSVTMKNTNHITLDKVRVKNSGMYGIIMDGDNDHNTITNSVVENTGYGGIIFNGGYPGIGKYNNNHTVENVLIHGVGDLVGHAVGLTLMSSGDNTFKHLEIYDTPKRAILLLGGYRRDRYNGDKDYDEMKDMYTVGNHFDYVHVHDAQQDAGEDSAVFLSWLLSGQDINSRYGTNDPNHEMFQNMEGIEPRDRYNYFNQMLITDVGADPSVIEKCTVGGLDTAMGASGSQFINVKGSNVPEHLLAIRQGLNGTPGSYGDMYNIVNCTNNVIHNQPMDWSCLKTFDDSQMEYGEIGLTDAFPTEYRVAKREYRARPTNDLYFFDEFEGDALDTTMWIVEKGEVDWYMGRGFMSENPEGSHRSLPITPELNTNSADGVVVSHPFDEDLNKIIEVQYFDRRKDYAGSDYNVLYPNTFFRADDGVTALGLGAVGTKSYDYYYILKGDEYIRTDAKRCFGWHTFKFDYSSGSDVKLYIDDQLVAAYTEADGVATSFNYVAMGDWEGSGGFAFYDQLYIYGGKPAQEPVNTVPAVHTIAGTVALEGIKSGSSGVTAAADKVTFDASGDWAEYFIKVNKDGAYTFTWGASDPADFELYIDDEKVADTLNSRVILPAGLHTMKLVAKNAGAELTGISAAYYMKSIPGKMEGEDADAFYNCQVDPESKNCIGWLTPGSYADFHVIVDETAVYKVEYSLAANQDNCQIDFVVDGKSLATNKFNSTGGWQSWQTFTNLVPLKAGEYDIRLLFVTNGYNVNWIKFTKTDEEIPDDPLPPALESDLLIEDFEGDNPTIFLETKPDLIEQEVVTLTDEELGEGMKSGNKALKVKCDDGGILYDGGYDWSNYIFESKIKIASYDFSYTESWRNFAVTWFGGEPASNGTYDHTMLQYQYNPKVLQLKDRVSGRTPVDDNVGSSMATTDFMYAWHDVKISTIDGQLTVTVDGTTVYDAPYSALSQGTIGFEAHNATFYVDDIKVTRAQTAAPTASVASGTYDEPFTVTLSATGDAVIVYTTDSSDPLENGIVYDTEKPIQITENTTLKFAAVEPGKTYSDIVTVTYKFSLPPVVGEVYLDEDFEDETVTEFELQKDNGTIIEVIDEPGSESNKILHINTVDNTIVYPLGTDWQNYTFECRIKINEGPGAQPWENVAPVWYAGSQDSRGNWNRYSLKYRFASGDFTLYCRGGSPLDNDFLTADAPSDYMGKWHDYRITVQDGHITAYIDGELIFETDNTTLSNGTIGFDGINTDFYVDDIKVTGPKADEPVERWNITLQDDLNVNFHLNLKAEDQVKFTVGTEETVYNASKLEQTADGKYIVTVEMAAAQMMDEIAIQVVGSNANPAIYTIRQYADTILAGEYDDATKQMVKNMLNYGAMAQVYFDHNATNLANAGITGFGEAEVTEATYNETIHEGAVDGIRFYSASLVYGSKVAVRLYFQVLSGSIEDYTFSNGTDNLTAVEKGDYYYIEFANITPDKWNEVVNLYVTKGEQNIHVQYSPLSYMVRMSGKATSSDALKNLLKAMYNYHLAASDLTSGS